ncbi:hypothetical protein V8E36_006146 [Tilletia maclaganii]
MLRCSLRTSVLGDAKVVAELLASLSSALASVDGVPRKKATLIVAIIKALSVEKAGSSYATIDWTKILTTALCSTSTTSRMHMREFVLPALFDHDADIFRRLCVSILSSGTRADDTNILKAIWALLKPAKQRGLCVVDEACDPHSQVWLGSEEPSTPRTDTSALVTVIPAALVDLSIQSADDELSTGALTLLSQSKSSATPFESIELNLLMRYFRANLNATDPGTRSRVVSMFANVLTRLRLSTYASARTLKKLGRNSNQDDTLALGHLEGAITGAQNYLASIARLCCRSLWPGASYPTMLSSLNYLDLMFQSRLDPRFQEPAEEDGSMEEAKTGVSKSLRKSMNQNPQPWPFELHLIDETMVRTLLSCYSSTFEDIRTLARRIIMRFPSPVPGLSENGVEDLLLPARRLMLSARASQAGTGTALLQTYGHFFSTTSSASRSSSGGANDSLLKAHVGFTFEQISYAEEHGVAAAAAEHPLHGCLWAMQQILSEDSLCWSAVGEEYVTDVISKTEELVRRVWNLVQPILCSQLAASDTGDDADGDQGDAPYDIELARAIQLAGGEAQIQDAESTRAGSFKHQALLSYGWRSMKEVSALVRVLVTSLVRIRSVALTAGIADQIGQRFLEWMTTIRHRGAFSVIYPELAAVAPALIGSSVPHLTSLPQDWLGRLTAQICSRDTAYSTTRRSAGLSYAVLALLQAEQAQTKPDLDMIRRTIALLTSEAERLQTEALAGDDARQVHLFNIIRILVLDGRVGPHLAPDIGQLLRLAVSRFQSDSWNLRNVAMLLFSATINRAFTSRQYQNKDDAGRKPSFGKFFAGQDGLAQFLIDELLRLQQASDGASGTANGTLFALIVRVPAVDSNRHTIQTWYL